MRNMNRLPYSRDNMLPLLCSCGNGETPHSKPKWLRGSKAGGRQRPSRKRIPWIRPFGQTSVASQGVQLFNRFKAAAVLPALTSCRKTANAVYL